MPYFHYFLILASMVAFRGHFEAVRGHIKLGPSYDLIWTYLSDIFVKELQLFLDLGGLLWSQTQCLVVVLSETLKIVKKNLSL